MASSRLGVRELKDLLGSKGIDYRACFEKEDLVALARKHGLIDKDGNPVTPPSAASSSSATSSAPGESKSETTDTSTKRSETATVATSHSAQGSSCPSPPSPECELHSNTEI